MIEMEPWIFVFMHWIGCHQFQAFYNRILTITTGLLTEQLAFRLMITVLLSLTRPWIHELL